MQENVMRKTRVYVAGPLTKGNVALNVRNAVEIATALLDAGYAPYVPHLTHFWHMLQPRDYEYWMELDIAWLLACDILLRLPGPSEGADREVKIARKNGIFVFFDVDKLKTHVTPSRFLEEE